MAFSQFAFLTGRNLWLFSFITTVWCSSWGIEVAVSDGCWRRILVLARQRMLRAFIKGKYNIDCWRFLELQIYFSYQPHPREIDRQTGFSNQPHQDITNWQTSLCLIFQPDTYSSFHICSQEITTNCTTNIRTGWGTDLNASPKFRLNFSGLEESSTSLH